MCVQSDSSGTRHSPGGNTEAVFCIDSWRKTTGILKKFSVNRNQRVVNSWLFTAKARRCLRQAGQSLPQPGRCRLMSSEYPYRAAVPGWAEASAEI